MTTFEFMKHCFLLWSHWSHWSQRGVNMNWRLWTKKGCCRLQNVHLHIYAFMVLGFIFLNVCARKCWCLLLWLHPGANAAMEARSNLHLLESCITVAVFWSADVQMSTRTALHRVVQEIINEKKVGWWGGYVSGEKCVTERSSTHSCRWQHVPKISFFWKTPWGYLLPFLSSLNLFHQRVVQCPPPLQSQMPENLKRCRGVRRLCRPGWTPQQDRVWP